MRIKKVMQAIQPHYKVITQSMQRHQAPMQIRVAQFQIVQQEQRIQLPSITSLLIQEKL